MALIYAVEDDKNILEIEMFALKNSGYQVDGFECARDFYKKLDEKQPDLILLNVMLPDEDGLEIVAKLRRRPETKKIPVIMVTAKGAEYDKVKRLDLGADDYVTKPFGMMELVSRVKAVLRRSEKASRDQKNILAAGDIEIDTQKHEVTAAGEVVNLTLKEYELLKRLMENQNVVMTRDRLLEDITRIVEGTTGTAVDREGFGFARFATHVQYLIRRVATGDAIASENSGMYALAAADNPQASTCVEAIAALLNSTYQQQLTDEEKLYLILHINRICSHSNAGEAR